MNLAEIKCNAPRRVTFNSLVTLNYTTTGHTILICYYTRYIVNTHGLVDVKETVILE